METNGEVIRRSEDEALAGLFAGWFDCENEVCPIAVCMECGVEPGDKAACRGMWLEWLSCRPPVG